MFLVVIHCGWGFVDGAGTPLCGAVHVLLVSVWVFWVLWLLQQCKDVNQYL